MKVALTHDWLVSMGGGENVIINFKEIFPDAPIYTSVYSPEKLGQALRDIDVRTSFLQKFKIARKKHRGFLPLMPMAWEQFDFKGYDIVLSSSHCCAKGIITSPDTMHVCYCHTPMRYAWEFYSEYVNEDSVGRLKRLIIPVLMHRIRTWDAVSANRVDYYIANSHNVARRIWKHYRREAEVIYGPIKAHYFQLADQDDDFFLIVSRLVPYKRVDLAVQAFNELGLPLVVIGGGPQLEYLKSIAKSNVKIMGRQPNEVVRDHYARCRAFLFPGEEDMGVTHLEANACGRPVIAFDRGGVPETVVEGETGIFFQEQTAESLKQAVLQFQHMEFDKNRIRHHALGFDESIFKSKIETFVLNKYNEYTGRHRLTKKIYV